MCGLSPPPPQRLITTSRPAWGAMDGPVSSLTLHASPRPCDKSTLSPHTGLHSTTDNPVTMETWMDRWRRGGAEVGSVDDSDWSLFSVSFQGQVCVLAVVLSVGGEGLWRFAWRCVVIRCCLCTQGRRLAANLFANWMWNCYLWVPKVNLGGDTHGRRRATETWDDCDPPSRHLAEDFIQSNLQ